MSEEKAAEKISQILETQNETVEIILKLIKDMVIAAKKQERDISILRAERDSYKAKYENEAREHELTKQQLELVIKMAK